MSVVTQARPKLSLPWVDATDGTGIHPSFTLYLLARAIISYEYLRLRLFQQRHEMTEY